MTASRSPPADVKCTFDLLQGNGQGQAARQPAQGVVQQPRGGHGQRRLRGDLPSEAAAAGVADAARLGLFADLSVPRAAGADAAAPDRHRAVQVRRVQAERTHQGRRATRITGRRAGPISTASNTRSCRTARPRSSAFVAGQVRHDLAVQHHGAAAEGRQEPGAAGELRADAEQRHRQPAGQPRRAAVRQRRSAPGDGAGARPQGVHRHHDRGAGRRSAARCCRRPRGCGACRRRCCRPSPATVPMSRRTGPRRAQIMEKLGYGPDKRLEVKVSTRNIADLSRPGGDPDRPAEGDLCRRRCSKRSRPPTGTPR